MKVDVVVIGAGVVGLFAAYELAGTGVSVAVVEKEPRPGMGVSSRHANVIHVIQLPFSSLKSRLCLEGNRLYSRYSEELGFRLRRVKAYLAASGPGAKIRTVLVARYLRWKLPPWAQVATIPGNRVRDEEPAASDNVSWAVAVNGYGVIDAEELVSRLARGLDERGGELFLSAEAVSAVVSDEKIVVELSTGISVEARALVNAAGLYSDRVASWFGDSYMVTPAKGVMTIHEKPRVRSILTHLALKPSRETKGGGIIPQLGGRTLLGPSYAEASSKEDYRYSPADVEALARRFAPLLSEPLSSPVEVIVGLRPTTRSRDFIIRRSDRSPRIIHLVGIESPGLTAAPAIARIVAGMLGKLL